MTPVINAVPIRHPRYVHVKFQHYLKDLGLTAKQRKNYAAWLSRFLVFHHGKPLESLNQQHIEHFLQFLAVYANDSEQQQHEAHCCLRVFYQCYLPDRARSPEACADTA